jgi:hypothetical protein
MTNGENRLKERIDVPSLNGALYYFLIEFKCRVPLPDQPM